MRYTGKERGERVKLKLAETAELAAERQERNGSVTYRYVGTTTCPVLLV
jgi:hypothetical protein